ncbi:MAG: 30S ribosomal protein S16 [SAR202 cluster bacterium]|nr:30S ribosomal protein S16 [SAR202 cluster bacterium]
MLRIRLRRVGKRKQPSYRIVVIDKRAPRDGAYLDQVGFYNPLEDPPRVTIDEAKATDWLRRGAQPSDAVEHMLRKLGVMEKAKAHEGTG